MTIRRAAPPLLSAAATAIPAKASASREKSAPSARRCLCGERFVPLAFVLSETLALLLLAEVVVGDVLSLLLRLEVVLFVFAHRERMSERTKLQSGSRNAGA
jgi:hypothetical protein